MMTPEQRKEIEERVAAATAGPWEALPECPDSIAANVTRTPVLGGQKLSATWIAAVDMENRHDYTDELESESAECDRSFIAHARTDIPAILSALDAAETRAKTAEEALRELWDDQRKLDQYEILRHPERMPNLAKWLKAQGCGE